MVGRNTLETLNYCFSLSLKPGPRREATILQELQDLTPIEQVSKLTLPP